MMPLLLLRKKAKPTIDWSFLGGIPEGLTFSRASNGWYFNATGALQQAANNAPRFDCDPATGELKGLLIEEARTNLFLNNTSPATQSVTVSATAYTLSFYGTGSITLSGAATGTIDGLGATARRVHNFTPSAGALTLTCSGSLSYAQLEAGAFPTSVIVTGGTAVTRASESLLTNSLPWFKPVAGTMMAEGNTVLNSGSGTGYFASLNDGTNNNRIVLLRSNTQTARMIVTTGNTERLNLNAGSWQNGANAKLAGRYSAANCAFAYNGGDIISGTPSDFPSSVTRLVIGGQNAGYLNGWLRRFRYWNYVLDNETLRQVTQ